MSITPTLNERAKSLADYLAASKASHRVEVLDVNGARIIDCGVQTQGGLQAGLLLARACLSKLGEVTLTTGEVQGVTCPQVQVMTEDPVLACMASQYAGWQIAQEKFFAMGSGPMRAIYGREELFNDIQGKEQAPVAVGILEASSLPDASVVEYVCNELSMKPEQLTLLVAPTSSIAGTLQVVARSVEMALHKLHELKFELSQVISALGSAPLPPIAKDDLLAIGRTNDAILYGGKVILWVDADDGQIAEIGARVPSSASSDHGTPFAEIFKRYEGDFYKIDPMLFSPAALVINNLHSGRCHAFGQLSSEVLWRSFFGN